MMIDPGAISLIQGVFLSEIHSAFSLVVHYALDLLYFFVAFEIVFTGFAWATQQDVAWGRAFFKIIKIGLIFFIIQNYASLTDVVVRSFADLGGMVANNPHVSQVIFNPAQIWQFGYDNGVMLLKSAASNTGFGLSMIQIILGMGILFAFGLLGIQIVLQIVGFYLISLIALIFLPFGAFNPSSNLFERAVQSVLQAGVKVMVLITVMGIAITVWSTFQLMPMPIPFNINAPMGLFFTALLFLYLAMKLPKMAANTVGQFSIHFTGAETTTVVQMPPSGGTAPASQSSDFASMQEATTISPAVIQPSRGFEGGGTPTMSSIAVAAGGVVSPQPVQTMAARQGGGRHESSGLASAQTLERSISEATARKMKKTFQQTLEEQNIKESISES